MTKYLDSLKTWVESNRSDLIFYGVEAYLVAMLFVGLFTLALMGATASFTHISDSLRDLVFSGFCVYFAAIYLCMFLLLSCWMKESFRLRTGPTDEKIRLVRLSATSLITLFSEGVGGTVALGVLAASPYFPWWGPGESELYALVVVGTVAFCVLGYRRRYAYLLAHAPPSSPEPGA